MVIAVHLFVVEEDTVCQSGAEEVIVSRTCACTATHCRSNLFTAVTALRERERERERKGRKL